MATLLNAYATIADLREHLGDEARVASENQLIRALNTASREIDKWCGRKFWIDGTVTTRTYRTEFTDFAWVEDIGSTTGLLVKTDPLDDGTFSESWTINTDFILEPSNADAAGSGSAYAWYQIRAVGDTYRFYTTGRRERLQVTALHGWSEVPPDVEEACLIRAAALYKRKDSPDGIRGFEGFGMRTTRDDPDVRHLLAQFQKVYVGAV